MKSQAKLQNYYRKEKLGIMKLAKFTYPNYGTPDGYPEYTKHSGEIVEIVRELATTEYDFQGEKMFQIKAKDGWVGSAWRSELIFKKGVNT